MTSVIDDVSSDLVLTVLGDPLRRRIVALLAREQLCTCHLVDATGAGQTAVSNALRVLREAQMVTTEQSGSFTYYRLQAGPVFGLADELTSLAHAAQANRKRRRPC